MVTRHFEKYVANGGRVNPSRLPLDSRLYYAGVVARQRIRIQESEDQRRWERRELLAINIAGAAGTIAVLGLLAYEAAKELF